MRDIYKNPWLTSYLMVRDGRLPPDWKLARMDVLTILLVLATEKGVEKKCSTEIEDLQIIKKT